MDALLMSFENGDWAARRNARLIASMVAFRGSLSFGESPGLHIPVSGPSADETQIGETLLHGDPRH